MLPLRTTTTVPSPRPARLRPAGWARSARLLEAHGALLLLDSGVLSVGTVDVGPNGFRFLDAAEERHSVFLFPRGPVWVQDAGGVPWLADATTLVRHRHDRSYGRAAGPVRVDWFGVAPDVLQDLAGRDRTSAVAAPDGGTCTAAGYLSQRLAFLAVARCDAASALGVEESTVRALDAVLSEVVPPPAGGLPPGGTSEVLVRARLAAHGRAAGVATVAVLAEAAGISPFHLCRTFKRFVGLTVHQYVNEVLLRRSLEPVAIPGADLSAIALDSGFCNHSHFTERFRTAFGVAPSVVRRRAAARNPLAGC